MSVSQINDKPATSTIAIATMICTQVVARMDPGDVAKRIDTIFTTVHDQVVAGVSKATMVEGEMPDGPAKTASIANVAAVADLEPVEREHASSLAGSTVFAPSGWIGLPDVKQKHFADLVEKHNLRMGENGFPIPNTPDGTIGGKETMYDPMTGQPLDMLKRRLAVYDLTPEDALAMFGLPADQVLVSRDYSERKRIENLKENRTVNRIKRPVEWRVVPTDSRRKFVRLIHKFELKMGENGFPVPNTPDGTIGGKETMYDPMTGQPLDMLKRRLKTYDLTPEEFRVMFGLPADTPMTAADYSSRKHVTDLATHGGKGEKPRRSATKSRARGKARETA